MKIISHRGNLEGSHREYENHPSYIQNAMDCGFDVEVDVWVVGKDIYLGHDSPERQVQFSWLEERKEKLWCHAKNFGVIERFTNTDGINYFWHETDKITLTSNRTPWLFPHNYSPAGVTVQLGRPVANLPPIAGICTDYPLSWKIFCSAL